MRNLKSVVAGALNDGIIDPINDMFAIYIIEYFVYLTMYYCIGINPKYLICIYDFWCIQTEICCRAYVTTYRKNLFYLIYRDTFDNNLSGEYFSYMVYLR